LRRRFGAAHRARALRVSSARTAWRRWTCAQGALRLTRAVVRAQEHSERVPRKNFRDLAGRPLYCWTLSALLGSSHISRVVIDTDCETLAQELAAHFPDETERITVRSSAAPQQHRGC